MNEEYKNRIKTEQEQALIARIKSKRKKLLKKEREKKLLDEYYSARNTGNVEWHPKHNATSEKWVGKISGKKSFIMERRFSRYSLSITDKNLSKTYGDSVSRNADFYAMASIAERIYEIYSDNRLNKKMKDEVQ